ncbi:MAG: hypothetical protein KZQ66_07435 [Candidatus Thiodiazotropha sp. (ex Lucinoma aequizonata)]|nr:hypothetical protein [Candidatus Thiodiazotropha sp. (ex Lucinoma aequizonata)]
MSETGLSMGGVYLTITNKENIAVIVKDAVTLVCDDIVRNAREETDPGKALEYLLKGYLFASLLLQPWFYFLYFETRSLPQAHQNDSKNLEHAQATELEQLIRELQKQTSNSYPPEFIATMALSMIQERYLKPWKYKQPAQSVDDYADNCLQLIHRSFS